MTLAAIALVVLAVPGSLTAVFFALVWVAGLLPLRRRPCPRCGSRLRHTMYQKKGGREVMISTIEPPDQPLGPGWTRTERCAKCWHPW